MVDYLDASVISVVKENKRNYTVILWMHHLKYLASGKSASGIVAKCSEDQAVFRLYHAPQSSSSFRPMEGEAYFAHIGDTSIRNVADLVKLLKRNGRIPIEMDSDVPEAKPINLGYVRFVTLFG